MCRLLLVMNKNINNTLLKKFLLQSISKKNTPYINYKNDCNFHKDGFGFAWKNKINSNWNLYKNENCFDKEKNIDTIINNINKNDIVIGHLRSICKNIPFNKNYFNTHPFKLNQNIWCHNGCISNFNQFKKLNQNIISEKYYNLIKGQTDSEFLFYMFISLLKNDNYSEIINTTIKFFDILVKFESRISCNIIFANQEYVLITRYINYDSECPSLYYSSKNQIISSEPITNDFELFDNHSAILFNYNLNKIISKINLKNF